MGFRGKISRSTLVDANEKRDWRIYADFARILIHEAKKLYINEPFGVDILDELIPEPGSFYVMDRAYIDFGRLYLLIQCVAFFVVRAKSNLGFRRISSEKVDSSTGVLCE
jgi:hypothetical protein